MTVFEGTPEPDDAYIANGIEELEYRSAFDAEMNYARLGEIIENYSQYLEQEENNG